MKIEIKSSILFKIIKKIIKITISNNNYEELSCFLLEVEKEKIILTASNGNLSLKYELNNNEKYLKILNIGSVLINTKIIYDIFSKLEDEWILFELKINNLIISNFKNDNNDFIFKLSTLTIEKFPKINFNKNIKNKVSFNKSLLQNINEQIAFATNTNNNKPALSGINFKFNDQKLFVTATDGYCLAKKCFSFEEKLEFSNKEFNIPVHLINEIDKITSDLNSNINFYFENDYNLIIEIENFLFQTRMIEGTYPNTDDIIKNIIEKEKNIIEINNVREFLKIIELSIILAKKDTSPMIQFWINVEKNDFKINCLSNNDSIGEVIEQFKKFHIVKSKSLKEEIKVVFNSKLIINALKSFNKCKKVNLKISWPKNYTIIDSEEETGLLQLVLPIGEK
ncbi:DNA polymerase III subunit beta [Spiroplasma endosymbiont of Danaus chrysippus]|uniref:DNA polymerase III subunit beta n=1 Tax=Spiroplasma endosymbiont of Danaus chrysippus TaxID=2691041 RepID=UPI0013C8FC25|nr:DNA polymerase III subunit beta [Spiroplasma endosymbiont of Danaus chrysippus]CAB1055015.1 DNA polymerase III beta subunit (EC 2.7.7.7) [Spiroplasma endosymbiont of Danaus chrysippus]